MKLGLFLSAINNLTFEDALKTCKELGLDMVEIGTGGVSYTEHCNTEELLSDKEKLNEFSSLLNKYELGISALSCHGNPLHPNKKVSEVYDRDMRNTILLAEKLGVDTINAFAGCPGDNPNAIYPNWICAGQQDLGEVIEWQWSEVVVPYWEDFTKFANNYGVDKIAIEMYAGTVCYNTETMLRLRDAVGPTLGANFDPTHIVWQGMDPVTVINALDKAIFHVHGKDVLMNTNNVKLNGVLDQRPYWGYERERAWIFRTIGYGFSQFEWKNMINTLLMIGYDGTISIEHEDCLMSQMEGIRKSVDFLKDVIAYDAPDELFWRKSIEEYIYNTEHPEN